MKSSFQHQIDHRINANVMANFCAKFEVFFFFPSQLIYCVCVLQNCLLAYFYRCVYLLTQINHPDYGKLAIKIIGHFLRRNGHLFVCVLITSSISFENKSKLYILIFMIENGEKETHFGDVWIGDDKREKQSNQEMNK